MPLGMRMGGFRVVIAVTASAALLLAGCSGSGDAPSGKTASAGRLEAAIAQELNGYIADDKIRAIIVDVGGKRRFEKYYSSSADQYRNVFSVTKSVMSALIGIAISEGKLSLDDQLSQMLPMYAADMKPGLQHQDTTPGKHWYYSDYGVHLLSPILEQATGRSALEYARTTLFDPLGIVSRPAAEPQLTDPGLAEYDRASFAWPVDPQGHNQSAGGIKMKPRDMATFGNLFLSGGARNGRQIVPADWVQQSVIAQAGKAFDPQEFGPFTQAFVPDNYGYLWWVESVDGVPAYFALGFGGQRIEIVPQRKLVIVISTEANVKDANAPNVAPEDTQRLIDLIVPAAN